MSIFESGKQEEAVVVDVLCRGQASTPMPRVRGGHTGDHSVGKLHVDGAALWEQPNAPQRQFPGRLSVWHGFQRVRAARIARASGTPGGSPAPTVSRKSASRNASSGAMSW